MAKTQKELAFLHDLYVRPDWTLRFTELADKHLVLDSAEDLLYINAGSGDHCFAIRDRTGDKTAIFGVCENEHVLSIARDKAIAVRSDVDFSTGRFDNESFDLVIADASFVEPSSVATFVMDVVRVATAGGTVLFFLPSAGSFGEIFSLLWEVLFSEDLGEHGQAAEKMISEIATVSQLKAIAADAGLEKLTTETANEVFEFESGSAFVASPLVSDFLLPRWLEKLSGNEKERVTARLAQLIDEEDGTLSFRFSVKATIVTGRKV